MSEPLRRADRSPRLRWWVYAILLVTFLVGLLAGALIW